MPNITENDDTHTPGPWTVPGTDGEAWVICHADRSGKRRTIGHAYTKGDARLIGRAPAMAAALKAVIAKIDEELVQGEDVPDVGDWRAMSDQLFDALNA